MPIVNIQACVNCSGEKPVDHSWLFEGISLRELRIIKKLTGMSQVEFSQAGDDGDPDALAALLYILHKRDKINIPYDDIDLDFSRFDMKLTEQEQKEFDEAEAQAKIDEANKAPKDEIL